MPKNLWVMRQPYTCKTKSPCCSPFELNGEITKLHCCFLPLAKGDQEGFACLCQSPSEPCLPTPIQQGSLPASRPVTGQSAQPACMPKNLWVMRQPYTCKTKSPSCSPFELKGEITSLPLLFSPFEKGRTKEGFACLCQSSCEPRATPASQRVSGVSTLPQGCALPKLQRRRAILQSTP